MSKRTSPLDNVRVAAPCSAGWDNMVGTERVRFCGQCSLNVYNLSAMTRRDAERLIVETGGRLCVRYYRRTDGTILTQNCPVGLRALKQRVSRLAGASISAILSFFAGIFAVVGWREGAFIPAVSQGAIIRINERLPEERAVAGMLVGPEVTMGQQVAVDYIAQGEWVEGKPQFVARPTTIKKRN